MTDESSHGAGGHGEPREVRVAESHGGGPGPATSAGPGDVHDTHVPSGDHGDHGATLGPVDVQAWAFGVLGVAIGLVLAVCFAMSTGYLFA